MAGKDYLFNGTPGNTVLDGTAATPTNTGASLVQATGGSVTHRTAAKHPGSPLGLRIVNRAGDAAVVRTTPDVAAKTIKRTTALTLPAVPDAGTGNITIWTLRPASGSVLRVLYKPDGHLILQKKSGSDIDLGAFAAGTKISIQADVVVGTGAPSTNGVLNFRIQAEGGATISGTTVGQTNADLGDNGNIESGDAGLTAGYAQVFTVDYGPDRWLTGAAVGSYIAQLTDVAPAVDSGGAASVDSAGSWTAFPSGTVLANVTDNDPDTGAQSATSPGTEDKLRFFNVRINPKATVQITLDLVPEGGTGGTWFVRLFDGATLKKTWTGPVADGIPTVLEADSTIASTLSTDAEGKWANLHVEFGYLG